MKLTSVQLTGVEEGLVPGNQGLSSAFPTNLSLALYPTDDHRCLLPKEAGVGKQAVVNEHLLSDSCQIYT